jgi:hypothetical protein
MADFFEALGTELQAAAARRPRRRYDIGQAIGVVAAAALVALAAAIAVLVSGGGEDESGRLAGARGPDPVGTVIPAGERGRDARSLVVASGEAPVAGPWQIEVSRTSRERAPDGTRLWGSGYCLSLRVIDVPRAVGHVANPSTVCGLPRSLGSDKTPGFLRRQTMVPPTRRPMEVLVWGRVPDRAATVMITASDGFRVAVEPTDGPDAFPGRYYLLPVRYRRPHPGARVNWLDANGEPGPGIRMEPPITP